MIVDHQVEEVEVEGVILMEDQEEEVNTKLYSSIISLFLYFIYFNCIYINLFQGDFGGRGAGGRGGRGNRHMGEVESINNLLSLQCMSDNAILSVINPPMAERDRSMYIDTNAPPGELIDK